jgi:flagellar FliL protein
MSIEHGLFLYIGAITVRYLSIVLLALSLSWTANAQAASAPAEPVSATSYVNLFPAIVGNYGAGSKLKYYKADIALRVKIENVDRVQYHEPLIRDQLIQLFAQQSDADMNEHAGKEAVRQAALLQVQQVLSQEEGETLVEDLLFNNLVVQP